ncbi:MULTISPECIES: molybdopterin-binding protein [Clostridium]|uniref:molybdopterin-binding protein n=1 Tax=Clostridium TaxID=1485 RepID=UPI0011C71CC6|nr:MULTISPECIES: molybdopterin-binding protein [Clostridium]MDU1310831.1 molybdopterin-binding protein [Clostridium sp.]MDU1406623.1 molybdopterin-binding protein [Clostridium sp.]MDU2993026.1 molybdopterin-binding protein [Clostridium sp.]
MKKIKTVDAVGRVLLHDITKIVPGEFKGRAFKKGHVIKEEDIDVLLSLGKDNIYVWEETEGLVHENDAAIILKDIACGDGLEFGEIKEGKIDFFASYDGVLKIDKDALLELNMIDDIMMATIHNNTPVKKGEKLGGTRVIPLMVEEEKLNEAKKIIEKPFISVEKFKKKKVGIVTTGNEVFYGRIKDAFGPVVKSKFEYYGSEILGQVILPDDKEKITEAIKMWIDKGADIVVCSGGMSVDPDDVTPSAIKDCGGEVVTYGSPVLPGAMFLLAYLGDTPIMGLPGCVMYSKRTVFDLVLPRILIDEKLTKRDIALYGQGGLCLDCKVCTFPHCSFGK